MSGLLEFPASTEGSPRGTPGDLSDRFLEVRLGHVWPFIDLLDKVHTAVVATHESSGDDLELPATCRTIPGIIGNRGYGLFPKLSSKAQALSEAWGGSDTSTRCRAAYVVNLHFYETRIS